MGTRFEMVIPEEPSSRLESLSRHVEEVVKWWEERLSRFRDDSDISRINREAAGHPVEVEEQVFAVLEECDRYHRLTDGLFDPAILALQAFWQEEGRREEAETGLPASFPGWEAVELDPAAMTVSLHSPDTGIDPGGFGKGAALRTVKKLLTEAGVAHALVSFGGSSILALGRHPHGQHWPVGIPNIFNPAENVYLFRLHDSSLSTSGVSSQRIPHGKEMYLHVLNPLTGKPVSGWQNVSVQHPDPFTAEVLSTAFLAADKEKRNIFLSRFPESRIILINYLNQKPNIVTFEAPKP